MNGAQLERVRLAALVTKAELARELGQHQVWVGRQEKRPEVPATTANIYLAGIEAVLQQREERRRQVASGLAELAGMAAGR